MKITTFAKHICKYEKGAQEVNIAQMLEILRCIRRIMKKWGIDFYQIVHHLNGRPRGKR